MTDWDAELSAFLQPFLEKLGHKKRRQMCPLYVSGLIGPGDQFALEVTLKMAGELEVYTQVLNRVALKPVVGI